MKKSERKNWQREMFSLIKEWQKSGMKQKDFCNQHDITLHAFYYWLRKYKQVHPFPILKGNAGVGLLAHLLISKFIEPPLVLRFSRCRLGLPL